MDDLNKALEPFVQELHKTVNAYKVSYNKEAGLVIKFSSDKIAKKMMKQYTSTSQTDPVKLEGDHIVVRMQSTQYQDVGVSSGTTVFVHSKEERDAFLRLFEGSTNLISTSTDNQKAVYFAADKAGYHNLPVECIGSNMEFCGNW